MPIVAMPDGTRVTFPDDMPGEDIRTLITQKFPDAAKPSAPAQEGPQQTPYEAARARWQETVGGKLQNKFITQPAADYGDLRRESGELMGEGVSRLGRAFAPKVGPRVGPFPDEPAANAVTGAAETALGAVNYAASPVNAALRTVVGRPVEETTGIPKEYPEFAAGLVLPIPKRMPGGAPKPRAAPSVEELKTAATAGYQSPVVTSVELHPTALPRLVDDIRIDLAKARVSDVTADKTFALLERAKKMPEGAVAVTVDNLESLRQMLGDVARPIRDATGQVINKPEIKAAQISRKKIDDYLAKVPEGDLIAGDAKAASEKLVEARGNWGAAEKAETINRKLFRAELRAAASHSGQNISNTMRQRITDILLDPAQMRGYSSGELALMEKIVRGGKVENTARYMGNFLGGGGGLGALVTTAEGLRALGPIGALLSLPGAALKSLSNVMTARNIEKLNEAVRANSPLARRVGTPLQDWATAHQQFSVSPTARNVARLSVASRNLSTNLADAGITVTPEQLMRSLQGPVRGGADDEQP